MKKIISISALIFSLFACQKETIEDETSTATPISMTGSSGTTPTTTTPPQDATLLLQGTFTSGVHATSGNVKVYEDKNKNRTLVFENFKTDGGPDLRVYMAEDKAITNFIQITDKVNTNGSYTLSIPANVDLKKQTTVVIWCRAFSVLFGSASLK
jgi:Electron transfer DM13